MNQFLRNFNKQKVVGLLNISSLSLGIMVAVIVGLWTINELSFDNFHKDKERIYRINIHATLNNAPVKLGSTFKAFGEAAKAELPQIEVMSRILTTQGDVKINTTYYPATKVFIADNNFFTYFNFPLKEGNPATALSGPDKVVISESAAKQYFPGQDAMGKQLEFWGNNFTVNGIMKDMPRNSSLQTNMVFPSFGEFLKHSWGNWDGYITFFTLRQGTDIKQTEESLKQILYKNFELFKTANANVTLEPLKDMHFSTGFLGGAEAIVKGNKSLIMVFAVVALVILIISCINFTNLFISTSFLRAKSVGIKKSQGASKNSLIREFYIETACYVLISIGIGVLLAYLAVPVFNDFTQANLIIDPLSPALYLFLIGLLAFTVLLAGTFPAFYMTNFNPIQTMGGKFKGKNISILQKSLIITQFAASIALLIVVAFMQKQVSFMVNYDLGFDKENVIFVNARDKFAKNYKALRDEMMKDTSIKDVTMKNSIPTVWQQGWGISNVGSADEMVIMEMNFVEPNYFDFMNMKIIDGENPFNLESTDSTNIPVVINESALKLLRLESPVGKKIMGNKTQTMQIMGVVHNANVRSLRQTVDPQIYMKNDYYMWRPIFFKVTGDPQHVTNVIRAKWQELDPDFPFEYHFLDDTYKELYRSEMNAQKILSYAMIITAIISIAGLFAMAFYVTQRRIKEIGLRKINGATLKDLLLLLNKDFILWVSISFCIAVPLAYFSLQSWLKGFTVKTSLSLWVFLLAGIIALAVTLLTTSFQTWKIATTNPVKTLKSE
jgi:putative ABC transport system permease protein